MNLDHCNGSDSLPLADIVLFELPLKALKCAFKIPIGDFVVKIFNRYIICDAGLHMNESRSL